MKKIFLAILVTFILERGLLARTPSMSLSLSPLQLFLMTADGKYGIKLNNRIHLTIPFSLQHIPKGILTKYDMQASYLGAGIGAKYFLISKTKNNGLYLDSQLVGGYSSLTIEPERIRSLRSIFLKTSLLTGYRFLWESGFIVDCGIGLAYNHAFGDESLAHTKALRGIKVKALQYVSRIQGLSSGFYPTGELSIGYFW